MPAEAMPDTAGNGDPKTREEARKSYTLKVPQHHHCRKCGNAFIGDGYYCSDGCKRTDGEQARKSLKKYILICGVLWVITIAAILIVGL